MSPAPKVTIAIPTYNRAELLRRSLTSALAQEYPDFRVLVLDNASTDSTEEVVRSFEDPRLDYVRNPINIGLYGNWCKAAQLNCSEYLTILQDDDIMLPGFIRHSAHALDTHGSAGLCVTRTEYVDLHSERIDTPDARVVSDSLPEGLIKGHEFLHHMVSGTKWILHFSAVMLRAAALDHIGGFDVQHSKFTIDLNTYIRIARVFDMVFLPQVLTYVGFHSGRDSQGRLRTSSETGPFAIMGEHLEAIAYLLQSSRSGDAVYRHWLGERLQHINAMRSAVAAQLMPDLNVTWEQQLEGVVRDLAQVMVDERILVLIDDGTLGLTEVNGRPVRPFLERAGAYWGAPQDDVVAISELERMRVEGAGLVAFAWPAFWWLNYYTGLRDYLSARYRRVLHNSRVVVYDVWQPRSESGGFAT